VRMTVPLRKAVGEFLDLYKGDDDAREHYDHLARLLEAQAVRLRRAAKLAAA
jgi:hypothetical protein